MHYLNTGDRTTSSYVHFPAIIILFIPCVTNTQALPEWPDPHAGDAIRSALRRE